MESEWLIICSFWLFQLPFSFCDKSWVFGFCRKEGLMKMGSCSVLTMGGLLMVVDLVLRFLRLHLKVRRHVLFDLLKRVPLGSLLQCLRGCSLFGLMRMVGRKQVPPSLQCNLVKFVLSCLSSSIKLIVIGPLMMDFVLCLLFYVDFGTFYSKCVCLGCLMTMKNRSLPLSIFSAICSMVTIL